MGVSAQPHATAALSPGKTLYMLYIGGWVDPRAGLGSSENLAPPTGIRSPDRSARSESLY